VLALLIGVLGMAVGMSPKLLDLVAVAFFGLLIIVGLVVNDSGLDWLERWAGELSNLTIALVALFSIASRTPFTIQYARETTPREQWHSPLFLHINYALAWFWTGAFLVIALIGWIGDGPLHQPDNIWTNWVLQLAVVIFALRFTDWYPDAASARADVAAGRRIGPAPTLESLFLPLAAYMVPVGIIVLVVGGTPWWIGVGLIVIGIYVTKRLGDSNTQGEGAQSHQAARG
jgi:hypothetical protein